jgi:hypothetical protein
MYAVVLLRYDYLTSKNDNVKETEMTMTLTVEQLMLAAKHIATSLVEDVQDFVVPADVETWSELHNWVDANEYAIIAFDELGLACDDFETGMEHMHAAEEVAFAVFRLTTELDEYRAMVKPGFRIVREAQTFVKTEDKVYRNSYTDRDLRATFVSLDGESLVNVRLASIKS